MTPEGIVILSSPFGHARTVERLLAAVHRAGMCVFCQLDHTASAATVGLQMRPAHVVLFGSAKAGTPLMKINPLIALDLPLRMAVWDDTVSRTWLSYVSPEWIAGRYGLPDDAGAVVASMAEVLAAIGRDVVTAQAF